MDGREMQQVVKLAAQAAMEELKFHLDSHPKYITEREARRKYGAHLIEMWKLTGAIKPVHTDKGKYDKFPLHELVLQYQIWRSGR